MGIRAYIKGLFTAQGILYKMGETEGKRLASPVKRYVEGIVISDLPQAVTLNLGDLMATMDAYGADNKPGPEWRHPSFMLGLIDGLEGPSNSDVVRFRLLPLQVHRDWDDCPVPKRLLQVEMTVQCRTQAQAAKDAKKKADMRTLASVRTGGPRD